MQLECKWKTKYLLGKRHGENIYLTAPKWSCGWYWSFGYLGNNNCPYHLDGIAENQNLKDAIDSHFDEGTSIFKEERLTWKFAELAQTAYHLKQTAEVLGRGGSHISTNPLASLIMNKNEVDRINNIVLPSIFDEIEDVIIKLLQHNNFLTDRDGEGYVITVRGYAVHLSLLRWDEVPEVIERHKLLKYDTSDYEVVKLKRGQVFKNSIGGDLIKYYNLKTGECRPLLFASVFTKEAIEDFKQQILKYVKGE